ncbi:MAG: ribonuclease III [Euryarchaeota archaeon]|nr:ribonuclease III [Euryarchaeota archaeon]|tara:strand:+ start:4113 stop:4784 length:672 start_codon:yes stop_codon:yes gene_type:complete
MSLNYSSTLDYSFRDQRLLEIALSHPSQKTHATEYQRFEFLGDSLLSSCISKYLFKKYPNAKEGDLNGMRASIVSGSSLSKKAIDLNLDKLMKVSPAYKKNFGVPSANMLEDTLEALVAAIFLDSDMENVEKWILSTFQFELEGILDRKEFDNPKGALQEWSQLVKAGDIPRYRRIKDCGPDHKKSYTVEVSVAGKVLGIGTSTSIKQAEIEAALDATKKIYS